jgi:hypothetical protein
MVPQLSDDQLEKEMWVVTWRGEVLAGFEAWRSILRVLPLTWLPALLMHVPPIPFIGRKAYAFVAARRPMTCKLQPPAPKPRGDWMGLLERAHWSRRKNLEGTEMIGETVNH